jgi:Carbohydrate esterase, sialic acid-specific acetylesterase/Secretion system C-terminal sorting domain
MKKLLILLFSLFSLTSQSQNNVELSYFPKDMQLLPRNVSTNKGNYTIVGKVPKSTGFTSLLLKIFKSETLIKETSYPLSISQDFTSFSIPFEINAELSNHRIELWGIKGNEQILIKKAEKVVAGDVIVINGQSNNIGPVTPSDDDPFLRSHTEQFGWNVITYTQPSRWAPRVAKNIITNHKIPVAIFNESYGGVRLNFFLKNETSPYIGNYGELMTRLEKAEVKSNIRALIWWQGESDGWETSIEEYKSQFKKLHAAWSKDYNKPTIYLFQIRFKSCTHIKPYVLEAQRQLSNEIEGLGIMSTNAAKSDSCHFYYTGGYDSLGNRMYRLMASKMYSDAPLVNVKAPDVEKIWFSSTNEITIQMKNAVGNLQQLGQPWADFRLETQDDFNTNNFIERNIQGTVSGNQIILKFTGDSSGIKGVTYLGHIDNSNDWIVNLKSVPIVSFFNFPISNQPPVTSLNTEGVSFFEISPTISSSNVLLKWSSIDTVKRKVSIYNYLGYSVFSTEIERGEKSLKIDVSNFISGHYVVVLNEAGKKASIRKFVKIQ